jgi:hypothetical protein
MKKFILFSCIVLGSFCHTAMAQADKWLGEKHRPDDGCYNNVKLNISSWLLYNNTLVPAFERRINKHQTFSIYGGYMELPSLLKVNLNRVEVKDNLEKSGYMIGGDYRFYLARENEYAPPHGLYIGPYISYYHFHNKRDIKVTDSAGNPGNLLLTSTFTNFNIGFQLGYQFVFAHHITLDLILIGPAVSNYSAKLNLDGNVNPQDAQFYNQEIVDALINRYPMLNKLLENKTVSASGNGDAWAPGFRYCIFIGYCFGRK